MNRYFIFAAGLLVAVLMPVVRADVSFSLKIAGTDGKDSQMVRADEMASRVETGDGIVWKGHPVLGEGFTVTAGLNPQTDGAREWSFAYTGNASTWRIEEVSFPEWTVPRTDRTRVFIPNYVGVERAPQWEGLKPGALVDEVGPCFIGVHYIASMDETVGSFLLDLRGEARFHSMRFEIRNGEKPDTLVLKCVHQLPLTEASRRSFAIPYTGMLTKFRGGWFDAAKIYRAWVWEQDWYKKAAARDFSRLREIALWMWNRGTSDVTVPPAVRFMKDTGLKVALDWYWWHGVPYDTCYPFFWPPREPVESFTAGIRAIHAAGGYVQPYTNGMLWDCDDARWAEGGEESAIVTADGKPKASMFNPYTRQCQAWCCGEAPCFQEKMRTLEKTIAATGMDGVYMDMIASAAFGPCHNRHHRHAPGGGRFMVDGYRDCVAKVRADNPGLLLSSEEHSEAYFDVFDSLIYVYPSYERFGCGCAPDYRRVPATLAVYHGAVAAFGSFATMDERPPWDEKWGASPFTNDVEQLERRYPDQFAVEFARGAVWGLCPTVHKFLLEQATSPRFAADYRFVKNTARFYYDNRDLLFDGAMLDPGILRCAAKRVDFIKRSCYSKPPDVRTITEPALETVFASVWQAKDGRRGAVLCNWSREPQDYAFTAEGQTFKGVLPARGWTRIDLGVAATSDPSRTNLVRDDFLPDNWGGVVGWDEVSRRSGRMTVERLREKTADGYAVVRLRTVNIEPGETCFRMVVGLPLVQDETCRFSARVRTHALGNSAVCRLALRAMPWGGQVDVRVPADTEGEWRDVTWEGKLGFAAKDGTSVLEISAEGAFPEGGYLDFAAPRLEGRLKNGSDPLALWKLQPSSVRLTPLDPVLDEMRAASPEMVFYYPGETEVAGERLLLRATLDGRSVTCPFDADHRAKAVFAPRAPGRVALRAELVGEKTGRLYGANIYRARVRDEVKGPTPLRKLNNFVSEIHSGPLADGEYAFTLAREGWVYVGFDKAYERVTADIDGVTAVRYRVGEKNEGMRFLEAGRHVVTVKGAGASAGGTLDIRLVKRIFATGLQLAGEIKPNFNGYFYGEDYYRSLGLLGGFNTIESYWSDLRSSEALKRLTLEMEERGVQINYGNGMGAWDTRRLDYGAYLSLVTNHPAYKAGLVGSFDENSIDPHYGKVIKMNATEIWWHAFDENRQLNVFFDDGAYSLPVRPSVDIPELSAYVNTGDGRSMLISEAYYRSTETQHDFDDLVDFMRRQVRMLGELVPSVPSRYFYLLNGWMMIGGYTSGYHTGVDMRALNGEVLRILATDPAFSEIGGAAFSKPACLDDHFRFIFAAMRYYCIEGGTGDFAKANGLTLWPRHLENGDFEKGFDGWRIVPAEPGSLSTDTIKEFAERWQGRVYPYRGYKPVNGKKTGDDFAVFTQSAKGPNRLARTITGLAPGRVYQLNFAVSDEATAKKGMADGKVRETQAVHIPYLRAKVSGAETIPELDHVIYFQGKYGVNRIFVNRVVFRATSPTATVEFSDWKTDAEPGVAAGQRTILNYVGVYPYYYKDEAELENLKRLFSKAKSMEGK